VRRREFIALLGGTAATWPLGARAQRLRRIGVLMGIPNDTEGQARIKAFQDGLYQLGWKANSNVEIDVRWATPDSVMSLARELISLQPEAILAVNTFVATALSQETKTVPIVFAAVFDPLDAKLVTDFAKPGGNVTGLTTHEPTMGGKWLQLLRELNHQVNRAVLLFNENTAPFTKHFYSRYFEPAGRSVGVQTALAAATSIADIERTITELAGKQDAALVVMADPFTTENRKSIVELAASHRVTAVYPWPYFVRIGGLISYGPDPIDIFRRAASYPDRILKGAKPGDLPVEMPTKFELKINVKTAKALGLEVPWQLQQLADEVIE
jgi:putative ABC transport system substrate-binding protein